MEANAILTPMRAIHMELEAANKSDMRVHGMCNLELSVHGLIINMDALVVDLNCHAILGMDILGDASKLPFILDLVGGTFVWWRVRNHTTPPIPGSNRMLRRNNRLSVHPTTFGGHVVGQTEDE